MSPVLDAAWDNFSVMDREWNWCFNDYFKSHTYVCSMWDRLGYVPGDCYRLSA
jgi:hypothetical protein